ncbi:aminotransferase class I/II-fold pyridoxal phosphate-dependent enzyme [Vibrio lentus]|uniref:aminotransferase class I/II-fold pyridoxal phosphate-dependent enzyme n=1 Tax=Vibrio lentus TaxID=136468 RepID=UPI000C85786C|nr:PLP-dependent aminotransferase family protein [Vibrio lentus]PMJ04512.1 hypothetical protein BCU32_03135 [Vibrio lentus]
MSDKKEIIKILNSSCEQNNNLLSLAAGNPDKRVLEKQQDYIKTPLFDGWLKERKLDSKLIKSDYSKSKGIIGEILKELAINDLNISVDAEDIFVTNGAQEAISVSSFLLLSPKSMMLFPDPFYPGAWNAASLAGKVDSFNFIKNGSIDLDSLKKKIIECKSSGINVASVYINLSFSNPLGVSFCNDEIKEFLDICQMNNIIPIIDDPYYYLAICGDRVSVNILNDHKVIYISSFSKIFIPGVRVGFAILINCKELRERFDEIKSTISITTSPVCQAIVAEYIISNRYSLEKVSKDITKLYKYKRTALISSYKNAIGRYPQSNIVKLNVSDGGFFSYFELSVEFDLDSMKELVEDFGVLVLPMKAFSNSDRYNKCVRVSFSSSSADDIRNAINKFVDWVHR